jgi:hypothetical protein
MKFYELHNELKWAVPFTKDNLHRAYIEGFLESLKQLEANCVGRDVNGALTSVVTETYIKRLQDEYLRLLKP